MMGPMTFAEIIFFCLFVAIIYRLLRPVQWRLERWIHRRITSRKSGSQKPVVEINDYKKNN
jgi:hypothetical protein